MSEVVLANHEGHPMCEADQKTRSTGDGVRIVRAFWGSVGVLCTTGLRCMDRRW